MKDHNEIDPSHLQSAFPEFEIVPEPLGRGGMKDAYLAASDGSPLVLKIVREPLDDELLNDAMSLPERVKREVEGMRLIDHPGVVSIRSGPEIREIGGFKRLWYTEPHYSGGTLESRLGTPWATGEVLDLVDRLSQAAEALALAGMVHRDIKPGNVVFANDGLPVLLDLGIALFIDLTPITDVWGKSPLTPAYAAPEQFELRRLAPIDFRTDLFLIGVVAFEALTGCHPFQPQDPDGYLERLNEGRFDVDALDAVGAEMPIRTLLSRLLAGPVSGRFRKFRFLYDEIAGCR